jgi:YVTN family beta-propeller protein
MAITPNGRTAFVADYRSNTVTPIDLASDTAGRPIPVGANPYGVAVTPDGAAAYVADQGSDSVTAITVATDTPGAVIPVGTNPTAITISR